MQEKTIKCSMTEKPSLKTRKVLFIWLWLDILALSSSKNPTVFSALLSLFSFLFFLNLHCINRKKNLQRNPILSYNVMNRKINEESHAFTVLLSCFPNSGSTSSKTVSWGRGVAVVKRYVSCMQQYNSNITVIAHEQM